MHPAWEKFGAIAKHLEIYETVLMIDDDVFVAKHHIGVEAFLKVHHGKDIIVSALVEPGPDGRERTANDYEDDVLERISTGVMIVRSTPFTRRLFKLLARNDLPWCKYSKILCCWDQDCFKDTLRFLSGADASGGGHHAKRWEDVNFCPTDEISAKRRLDRMLPKMGCDPWVWHHGDVRGCWRERRKRRRRRRRRLVRPPNRLRIFCWKRGLQPAQTG